jgi:oligopeptidase B
MRPLVLFLLMPALLHAGFVLPEGGPPLAERRPKDVTVHGDTRIDAYFWLRERENPAVLDYLKAENAYTQAVMAPATALKDKLFAEIRGRVKETDLSVPYRKGGYVYYTRYEAGSQYAIHCRRLGSMEAPEEVLLDVNALAQGEKFMELGHFEVSDNARLLAYSVDRTGYRQYELRVKDLMTGETRTHGAVGAVSSLEWMADNARVLVVTEDPVSKRAHLLSEVTLANGAVRPLYDEKDEQYDILLDRSLDGACLFATSVSKETSEVRLIRSEDPQANPMLLFAREEGVEIYASHREGLLYLLTNRDAFNFRVVTAPVDRPTEWTDFIPHNPEVRLSSIEVFRSQAVVEEREDGLPHLRIIDLVSGKSERMPTREPAYTLALSTNAEYDTTKVRYAYQSLVTPSSVFDYDIPSGESTLLKQAEVVGGYDPSLYASERVFATASDGARIPIALVYRRDKVGQAPAPLYLYAYGSYGFPLPNTFSSSRLSLLDRGVVFAMAHIRGGGEMGETWHEQGKMKAKMNTFTDFIACAEHLVREGRTTPDRLVISGGSAGGLLMGAVLNLRPDLFKAAIAAVPFVDVLNTMLDATLPLTTAEYLEWGNPNIPEEYAWMRAYSPYDNLAAKAYPHLLVNVSLHDSQVPYWEGAKFVAKMRTLKTGDAVLLLNTNLDAGHGGASGRFDLLREVAFDYAFLLTALGIEE